MTAISYGDMGASLRNMRLITQVKQDLDKYSYEVSSGQKQDLAAAVSGDFTPLASIERSLRTLESYDVAIQEANLFATSMQTTFGAISSHVADLSSTLLTSSTNGDATSISVAAQDARTRFDAVISGLNTRIGDRSLFSGTATSKTALIPAEDMLTELQTAVAGATTAADVETIVDDWFMSAGAAMKRLPTRAPTMCFLHSRLEKMNPFDWASPRKMMQFVKPLKGWLWRLWWTTVYLLQM
ncbi:flagellin [Celeribacter baekdonensis]|uniref:Uncharacterized protein n=1 Tax=Celeribacter baekdonensis TaxID=875171 RepID=A0A2R4M5V2_9RHOB|nr:hypothetical protein [Celeribacter baekdonensis]AVW92580.1 hypothetical protein DA792_17020 [Celeribacter baekdonensis]